jgi:hypothetical protein
LLLKILDEILLDKIVLHLCNRQENLNGVQRRARPLRKTNRCVNRSLLPKKMPESSGAAGRLLRCTVCATILSSWTRAGNLTGRLLKRSSAFATGTQA